LSGILTIAPGVARAVVPGMFRIVVLGIFRIAAPGMFVVVAGGIFRVRLCRQLLKGAPFVLPWVEIVWSGAGWNYSGYFGDLAQKESPAHSIIPNEDALIGLVGITGLL